ncbi:MAG: hypothetical protein NDJ89_02495 [Oligoflexia bacterium]|nr:hypothetical protein [Oligoflexia bacterium]
MKKLNLGLVLCALALAATALADDLTVTDGRGKFVTKRISATRVKGVEITLSRDIEVDDCNRRQLGASLALVSGSGDGYYDAYFVDAGISMTEMYCPRPVTTETLVSKPMFVSSFSNENVDGEVELTLIVPEGFTVNVTEVK